MTPTGTEPLWVATDRLLERASLAGILAHKLGPLAASRLRRLGRPLPRPLLDEERAASLAMLTATPLIHRIRDGCDGPLLLLKGPEIAQLYPRNGRRFGDVDVLTPTADDVQRSLLQSGFVPSEPDFDLFDEEQHHHLEPLRWPTIWLNVEVHSGPNWPPRAHRPPLGEILEAAVPSACGIAGVLAPHPLHHALILTSHAWRHEPLFALRDLIDIAVLSQALDADELDRLASRWGIDRIWATTRAAIEGLFYGGRRTVPLRTWARQLERVEERTVFENHLQRWLHVFWELPFPAALGQTTQVLRSEVVPAEGESWGAKLGRVAGAVRNPGAAVERAPIKLRAATLPPAEDPASGQQVGDDDLTSSGG